MNTGSIAITVSSPSAGAAASTTSGGRLARRTAAESPTGAAGTGATESVSVPQDPGPMAHRDLRHISFSEMAQLGKDLVAAGILPQDKMLDFIPLRSNFKVGPDGALSFAPDAPTDMIRRQQDIIASQKASGVDRRSVDHATSVLTLYQNIQALHEQASA